VFERGALAGELGEGEAPSRGLQRSGMDSILLRVHFVCKPRVEACNRGVGGGTGACIAGRKGKRLGVGQHVERRGVGEDRMGRTSEDGDFEAQ
jgi:hypothetical protein